MRTLEGEQASEQQGVDPYFSLRMHRPSAHLLINDSLPGVGQS